METQRICPKCQKPLPADVPLGLCPECLIKAGFSTGTDPADAGGPAAGFVPPPIEQLARLFPQLEILEFIGKGGMGAVYKARQPALDRFVALKILTPKPDGDPGFAERFNREARALARLTHPNIVAVHDFGRADTLHFLIMEFVDGANLRQVERAGRLRPEQALEIVPQICDALQFAHAEGIVHRDIKPENILLDKKGRVKITDFGIAKILGVTSSQAALTGAKDIVGTPHYMAPEQVEKPQLVDHRADIYSLGVVFYEMLTGELPLGRFQPPSKKVQVDVRLDEVVLHALEKEPERRYQHASEVKTAVETLSASDGKAAPRKAGAPVSAVSTSSPVATSVGWRSVPWQIWVVVAILALEGLGNLFAIPSQPQAAIWLLAKVLFITGLLRRWRPVFVLNLVVAGIHVIYFAFHGPIAALLNLVLLVLVGSAYRFYFNVSNAESPSPRESGTSPSGPERLTAPSQAAAKSPRQRASLLGMGAGLLLPPVLFTWFLLFGHRLYGVDLDADVQFWLGVAGLPISAALGLMLAWIGHMAFRSAGWLPNMEEPGRSRRWCPQAWVAASLLAVSLPFAGGAAVMLQLIALDGGGWHPGSSEFWIVMLLGAGALLTMLSATMLGLMATNQIRRAQSQLRGHWPASAAAVFWPGVLMLAGGMAVLPGPAYTEPNLIVTGTVVDAETGKPIAGARVDDNRYGAGHAPQQAWTDASGGYELRTWYEEHTISASAPGYAPNLQTLLTKPFGREGVVQVDFKLKAISQHAASSFGPVIERIIAGEGDANQRFIDFDTGKLFAAAEFFGSKAEPSPEETQKWWKENGMDAVGDTSPAVRGLIGFEMVAVPVPSEEWDRLLPARLDYSFTLAKPGTPATLSGKGVLPATFAIKTREGGKGLLQITEISDQPPGLKVRYKLLKTAPPLAPLNAAPAPRHFVRLVVDKTAMTFEGQPTTWETVPALLERVPDRTNTVLELAVTSDQITVAQQNEWFQKAVVLAREFQFAYASFIGIHPLGSKGTATPHRRAESSTGGTTSTPKTATRDELTLSAKGGLVVVELPGSRKLTADSVHLDANGTLTAKGNVRVQTASRGATTNLITVLANGGGTHASIQAAVDAAAPHTTIRIGPGRFEESLVIGKPVTLEGDGWDKTVIGPKKPWAEPPPEAQREAERRWRDAKTDEARRQLREEFTEKFSKPVLGIQGAKDVRVLGLRFTQPGIAPDGKLLPASVIEVRDAELVMRDCAIVGSPGNGLVLAGSARAQVSKTLVAAAWNTGIVVKDAARAGIFDSDIRNCHYAGITIGRGLDRVTIQGCRISGAAWHGVRYEDASPTIADSLIFANARCGIYASGKTAAEVRGNVFWKNEMNGMSCWFANRDRITNNTFAANRREGLSVLGASEPVIERNIFWGNPQGIQQGNVNSKSANAMASSKLQLRENWFWTNDVNIVSSVGRPPGDTNAPAKASLVDFPGNREADPGFRDAAGGDFTLLPDGPTAKAAVGALNSLTPASPWPLQAEEKAIIPDGDTRDSRRWKRAVGR